MWISKQAFGLQLLFRPKAAFVTTAVFCPMWISKQAFRLQLLFWPKAAFVITAIFLAQCGSPNKLLDYSCFSGPMWISRQAFAITALLLLVFFARSKVATPFLHTW
jgi:hypothetical protein